MKERIKQIQLMEHHLISVQKMSDEMEKMLENFAANFDLYAQLVDYYTSSQWIEDYEAYEQGIFPKEINAGVLGEDSIYNVMLQMREIALMQLDLATKILKK